MIYRILDDSDCNNMSLSNKLPKELGLYDFSGNVMEWTQCDYWGIIMLMSTLFHVQKIGSITS